MFQSTPPKTISLNFEGYWRAVASNIISIPDRAGVYLVYVCRYDSYRNVVLLDKLIYIGESDDVRRRIQEHMTNQDWLCYIPAGSEICVACAGNVYGDDRGRAQAALIYYHKPIANSDYKYNFPFEDTVVQSSGRCDLLTTYVIARRT